MHLSKWPPVTACAFIYELSTISLAYSERRVWKGTREINPALTGPAVHSLIFFLSINFPSSSCFLFFFFTDRQFSRGKQWLNLASIHLYGPKQDTCPQCLRNALSSYWLKKNKTKNCALSDAALSLSVPD